MSIATSALIETSEYIKYIGQSKDDSSINTAQVEFAINTVSGLIADYCNRTIAPATDVTEIFNGDGTHIYFVNNRQINSVTSISYWDGTTYTAIDNSVDPYTFDAGTGGKFYFKNYRVFVDNARYQIIYNTGYNTADVPTALKYAACVATQRLLMNVNGREGLKSESVAGQNITYDLDEILDSKIKQMLLKYKAVRYTC